MFKNIAFLLFFVSQFIYSQETIKGIVTDENNQPLLGANVFWFNTAVGTTTDENGNFTIKKSPETSSLVISYIGFETQKIDVVNNTISVILKEVKTLKEVRDFAKKNYPDEKKVYMDLAKKMLKFEDSNKK